MKTFVINYRGKLYKVKAQTRMRAEALCKKHLYATAYGNSSMVQQVQTFNP